MRITKYLRTDQETIVHFLDMLGVASSMLSGNKHARPGFFIFAHTFMHEYIEESFFKKEELLFKALADSGFPVEDGPIVAMRLEQAKSIEIKNIKGESIRFEKTKLNTAGLSLLEFEPKGLFKVNIEF